jgi:hypothetical protein
MLLLPPTTARRWRPPRTFFAIEYERNTGNDLFPILTPHPIDSEAMQSSITALISYISGDPDRAIGFLLHAILSPAPEIGGSTQHRLCRVCESFPSEVLVRVIDRLLGWYLGYRNPFNASVRDQSRCAPTWAFLDTFSVFPELTNLRIRDALVKELQTPDAYYFLVHLYKKDFRGITKEFPELFEGLRSDVALLREMVADGRLEAPAFIPMVRVGDCRNPRCIKFGGLIPHERAAGYPICRACRVPVAHVLTIYVPLLPPGIQEMFPEGDREHVIVVCYCEQCSLQLPVFVFRDEEIDRLVMSPDHVSFRRPFNEPRVVIGWKEARSRPDWGGVDQLKISGMNYRPANVWNDLVEPEFNDSAVGTYVGGFPRYVQDPARPTPSARLLVQMQQSRASTAMWGDCGTAQLWMETGENYGKFQVTWSCC